MWSLTRIQGSGFRVQGFLAYPSVFIFLFLLSGCGFTPIYAAREEFEPSSLPPIEIADIPGRDGRTLRMALEDALVKENRDAAEVSYLVKASLTTKATPVVIEPDGTASRYQVVITAPFSIVRASDGKTLTRDKVWRAISYNVSEADYSTFIASRDAMRRGIEEIGRDMSLRVISFLHSPAP